MSQRWVEFKDGVMLLWAIVCVSAVALIFAAGMVAVVVAMRACLG